jgi:hypothetical protein
MKRLPAAVIAIGVVVLLYFYFLPLIIMLLAPKTDLGEGHFIIFSPPHADPVFRWRGVLTGAALAGAGSFLLFLSDKRRSSSRIPILRFIGSIFVLAAVTGWTAVQSNVAQQPDYLSQQYFKLHEQHPVDGIGIGWPAQEADTDPLRRGTIEVAMAYHPERERDHVYVEKLADTLYSEWHRACYQAALEDGATFNKAGMVRPHKRLMAYPVIDPEDCAVYIKGQNTGWCIRKNRQGIVTIWGSPPL